MEKLTIVVRSDIPPGAQLAQTGHAVGAFAIQYPDSFSLWARVGKNIVVLGARDLTHLMDLYGAAALRGLSRAIFAEPDIGGQPTAIALGDGARKVTGALPKALRDDRG